MAGLIREVLEAASQLGHAHRRLRHVLDETDQRCEELKARWLRDHAHLVDNVLDADPELDHHHVEQMLSDYLLDGDRDRIFESVPDSVLDEVDTTRKRYMPEILAEQQRLTHAEAATEGPRGQFAAQLRTWLEMARAGDTEGASIDDWPRILRTWRTAVDRTTREAAEVLQVSPSAIVRYENGERSPAVQYIAAMIERIAVAGADVADTRVRVTARAVARMRGNITATEVLETVGRRDLEAQATEQLRLHEEIASELDRLGHRELQAIAALVRDYLALAALLRWADHFDDDPLRPVLDALIDSGVRPPVHARQAAS